MNELKIGDKLKFIKDTKGGVSRIHYKKNQIITVTKIIKNSFLNETFEINNLNWNDYGYWSFNKDVFMKVNSFKNKIKFVKELINE